MCCQHRTLIRTTDRLGRGGHKIGGTSVYHLVRKNATTVICEPVLNRRRHSLLSKIKNGGKFLKKFFSPEGEKRQQWIVLSYRSIVTFLDEATRVGILIVADHPGRKGKDMSEVSFNCHCCHFSNSILPSFTLWAF